MGREKNCSFCDSIDIAERTILSTGYAWAFLTNSPIVPGHMLICPKRCVTSFDDLKKEEIKDILKLRSKLKSTLSRVFNAEGFNYAWNEGSAAGQTVPHFHLHMLPRRAHDKGITDYEPRKFLYRPGSRHTSPRDELKSTCDLIKKALINSRNIS